jgi:glutamate-ammonia-ligase adenylyltransferase
MGKLGSRELSVASDLDIIFVYDGDPDDQSNGAKPLHTSQYFARLSQRLISAISAPTAEGSLYEVDARLRPSGKSGPLAVTYEGFRKYQFEDAWTWEKMALTRARVITGPKALRARLDQTIRDVLCQPREVEQVLKDAREMRLRIANEITRDNPWDLKHVRGGLVDLEFTIQTLQLIHAAKHPQVLNPNTMIAIGNLHEAGAIDASLSQRLTQAAKLLHRLTQIIRYCVEGTFDPDTASHSLIKLLTTTTGTQDFPELDKKLRSVQQDVLEIFENLVEGA